jgi:predicted GIY-YIG superfamily endonuclease
VATKRARTIQIFLPSGDPSGIRIAEQTTSIIRLIEVPRSDLAEFVKTPESKQVGLYFLVSGESKDEIYIGQTGDVGVRLMQHHKNESKDWERALVLVSLTNNLTQTHVLYLESLSIEKARECQRYELQNGNGGQKPYTPIPLKADCDEIHEIGSLLLATLGYPIFEPLTENKEGSETEYFYCRRSGVDARGIYTNEGMVVIKGSSGPFLTKRKDKKRHTEHRDELLAKGVLKKEGDTFVFQRDYLFKSPSGASSILVLSSSNGWVDWKTKTGVTLHDFQGRGLDVVDALNENI